MSKETADNYQIAHMLKDKAGGNIARCRNGFQAEDLSTSIFQVKVDKKPTVGQLLYDVVGSQLTQGTGKNTEWYFGMVTEVEDNNKGEHLCRVKTDASGDQWISVVIESKIQEEPSEDQSPKAPSLAEMPNPWGQKTD